MIIITIHSTIHGLTNPYTSHHPAPTRSSSSIITASPSSTIPLLLLLLIYPAAAQTSPSTPSDPYFSSSISPSMGVIILVLISALLFVGLFSIYVRHCTESPASLGAFTISARSRRAAPRGLDQSVINSFPTFPHSAVRTLRIGKGALECAVCLNEFDDCDTLRLIPVCDHVFHPDCIDAWLAANTTCPVCRANLTPQSSSSAAAPAQHGLDRNHSVADVVLDLEREGAAGTPREADQAKESPSILEIDRERDESMERPVRSPEVVVVDVSRRLKRNRTRRNLSGRPGWLGKLMSRSNSTGHLAVKQWEGMDRYTLRLPEDVRRKLLSGRLTRSTSCVVLPREGSSRAAAGEGTSRWGYGRFGSVRSDRGARLDLWGFSLPSPAFLSRWPSMKSPRSGAASSAGGGEALIQSTRSTNNSLNAEKSGVVLNSTIGPVNLPV